MFYQLNANTAASTESALAPTNASVSQDTPERHVIKVGILGPENMGETENRIMSFPADDSIYEPIAGFTSGKHLSLVGFLACGDFF